ncbi:Mitochondrial import inner membrane translocase subunit Tim10 [Taenia solium]|eukprot:TsM_000006300 transcript=TsM_000006300 gene=TsM_000006300
MADLSVERQMQMFEIEMMQKVFSNMTKACLRKCIPPRYHDGDLSKGEAVCLDRCAAKFMEAYMHTTKTLGAIANPGTSPQ